MLCPVCRGANIKVLDSRDSRDGVAIRRRRACSDCAHRFTTYERIETSLPMVLKRSGGKQAFDRNKILAGLKLAVRKRPVEDEQLENIVASVELWAATRGDREIHAEEIGERIMQHLHALDPVAYVRFVSVYRSFDSVQAFAHLLHEMEKAARSSPEGQRKLFEIDARGQIQVTPRSGPDDGGAELEGEANSEPGAIPEPAASPASTVSTDSTDVIDIIDIIDADPRASETSTGDAAGSSGATRASASKPRSDASSAKASDASSRDATASKATDGASTTGSDLTAGERAANRDPAAAPGGGEPGDAT